MYTNDPKDLAAALSQMETTARNKFLGNQVEAKEAMKNWLELDRRFDNFNKNVLIDRVMLCKYNGAHLDFEDPELYGLPPRPLTRSRW